jgi:hypothetical protein
MRLLKQVDKNGHQRFVKLETEVSNEAENPEAIYSKEFLGRGVERQGSGATFIVAAFDLGELGKSGAESQIGRDRQDTTPR